MARRQTAQNGTSSRVNMMQSACGPEEAPRLVIRALERADFVARGGCLPSSAVSCAICSRNRASISLSGRFSARIRRRRSWVARESSSYRSFGHGVGSGVPGLHEISPLERRGIEQRRDVRLPRLDPIGCREVRDVGRVVLVGERREVMAELVDEDVRRPHAVGGHGAVQAVDAAAAVGGAVGQDLDDVVRRVGGEVAEGAVVEGEDVALGVEGVVGRADRRAPMNALRRPRHARLRRRAARGPRR